MNNPKSFDDTLIDKWFDLYEKESETVFKTNLDNIEMKKMGKYLVYYN